MDVSPDGSMSGLLRPTPMLDFESPAIRTLVASRGWDRLPSHDAAAQAVYEFCRDEIAFGYNALADDMPASAVLREGLGHCNTKSTLLMALLRAVGIPCRIHAFTIDKRLQRGAMTPLVYHLAPREILHAWVEAWVGGRWITLEGQILDMDYLHAVQHRFANGCRPFMGFAVATRDLQHPQVQWTGGDTFIQREGIVRDLGVYDCPDEVYAEHGTNLKGVKGWLYRKYLYRRLNRHVARIRAEGRAAGTPTPPSCTA